MEWIIENIGTVSVAAVVAALLIAAVMVLIRKKRSGSCCGGCSGCALNGSCRNVKRKDQ